MAAPAGLVGKYILLGDIGSGAHGVVVQARDTVLGRTVALKSLKSGVSRAADGDGILREAKTLAQLRHANVVTLYEIIEQDGETYLVMEYVDGAPLSDHLDRGAFEIVDALAIADQLLDALAAAHALGIVHGDIKPGNIVLDQAGVPRLIDFGLAKIDGREDALATISAGGEATTSLQGTLPYMAPEIVMGRAGDARADIFSLGAVLYEMLCGKRAFDAESQGAVLQRILNDAPAPLRKLRPEIPASVEAVVARMLEKDEDARFQSMAQARAGFAAARGEGGAAALAVMRLKQWARVLLRRRATPQWAKIVGAAAALGVVAWAGLVISRDVAPPVSVRMEQGIGLVRHFEKKGAVKEAQDLFGRILSDDPDHAAASAGLALALIREYTSMETDPATLRRATAYADASLKADPHLALANIAAAWAAEFNSDFTRAHELYDAAEMLDPGHPLALEGRARTLKKQGDYDGAIAVLEKAIETHPEERIFYDDYGGLLSRQGEYAEAEKIFRKGISIESDSAFSYANLAQVLHMQGKTAEAISIIQDGLKVEKNPKLYNNLGVYLFFQGRYAQAATAFERTLEFEGNTQTYFYWANLADAYRWVPEKRDDAELAYRRAVQLIQTDITKRPKHPGLNSRLALYAAKGGDASLAKSSLAIAVTPPVSQPIIFYRAGVTKEILGDRISAINLLERAIDAGYAVNEIINDPELAKLRQDPAWQQLLARKGITHG